MTCNKIMLPKEQYLKVVKKTKTLKKRWDEHPIFASFVIFFLVCCLFGIIYLPSQGISALDDHFFHFKMAYILQTQGLESASSNFDFLYLWKDAQEGERYPVSLFQVAMIPFTYAKDLVLGLKISDIFWISFSSSLLYWIFRKAHVRYPLFFMLVLFSSSFYIGRMLIGRMFVITTVLFFLEVYLSVKKKSFLLFWVSLAHVLLHVTTFYMPLCAIAMGEIGRYLETKKFFWKNFMSGVAAVVFGMAFFPDFPQNIWKWIGAVGAVLLHANQDGSKVEGQELYVREPFSFFWSNPQIFGLVAIIGIFITIYFYIKNRNDDENKIDKNDEYALMYAIFFALIFSLAATMILSGRFFEFYIISAVFLLALIFSKLYKSNYISLESRLAKYIFSASVLFFVFTTADAFIGIRNTMAVRDYRHFEKVANWLEDNSENKEHVFLQNWSWFSILFFFNDKNTYSSGLEPEKLKEYSPRLYWKWFNIYNYNFLCEKQQDCEIEAKTLASELNKLAGDQKEKALKIEGGKIINTVKNDFQSRFIVSDSVHLNYLISLNQDSVESSFEAISDINGSKITVYKLR